MKYDFTRCNNLNFKVKDNGGKVREGYLKVSSNGYVYLYYSGENKIFNPYIQIEYKSYHMIFTDTMNFHEWAERHELEIFPRDPETYKDWKVGDEVIDNAEDAICIIIARLGEVVFIKNPYEKIKTITSAWVDANYKLILTDYEQELLKAQEKKQCPFRKGDRVLVRDNNEETWRFDTFDSYEGGNEFPYDCECDCYRQCIPYNEKTWKLLGTTDEYKEE